MEIIKCGMYGTIFGYKVIKATSCDSRTNTMPIIIYNSFDYSNSRKLLKDMGDDLLKEKIEIAQTLEDLSKSLRRPNNDNVIAVLFVEDLVELYHIIAMKKALIEFRVIVILPSRSSEMISASHKLHPRFISSIENDFKDVANVIRRLIKLSERNSYAVKDAIKEIQ
jgi:hypothetical protein